MIGPNILTPRRKRGFSLLEAAVVLGVVGLVIGGIWGVASSVRASMQANQLHQQTLNLVSSIRDYYANRPLPSVTADMTDTLRTKGRFPEEMCPANCVAAISPSVLSYVRNAYGGTATVTIPNPATYSNQFYITYLSVDKKGCMELGMKLSARAPEIGLVSFAAAGGARTTFPIPLTTLKGDCPGNSITLYFKIRM
jgi:type II secretory pathway pseudopilin PulG